MSLKSLDQLNKPEGAANLRKSADNVPLNKERPEFAKAENIGRTILGARRTSSSSKPAPPPSSKGADPEKQKNIKLVKLNKIKKYVERWPNVKSVIKSMPTISSSEDEIDQVLFDIHLYMNSSSSEKFVPMMVVQGLDLIEKGTMNYFNPLNLDLTGLAKVAQMPENNQKLMDTAYELYIEYQEWFNVGPQARFTMEVLGLMFTIDSYNKARRTYVNETVTEEMEKELNKDPDDNSNQ